MGPLVIILGSELDTPPPPQGQTRIVTPEGYVLSFSTGDIVKSWNVDAGGDLKRYALQKDSPVIHELTAGALANLFLFAKTKSDDKNQDDKGGVIDPINFPPRGYVAF